MATKEPAKDVLRDLLDKLEQPAVRWALVCVGVVILVRLKLILFAAALPVMAYWHYSHNQASEESAEPSADAAGDDSRPPAKGNRDDDEFDNDDYGGKAAGKDDEVYDKDFWASDDSKRTAPRNDDDDDFGSSPAKKGSGGGSWSEDPSGGPVDDFPKARSNMDDILGSLGSGGDDDFGLGKMGGDLDFGLGGGDDMDFLSQSFGGGFGKGASKGKGKGKGKDGDKDKGPREANPKQVFVAGIGDLQEDELRQFFEDMGEVDRLKVLTTPEGDSKGVCFVTFRSEEQANKALGQHDFSGRNISVRLANGGNKGDKDKGGGKGGGGERRERQEPMEFGRSERFGAAFGDDGGGGSGRFAGGGGGRGGGGGKGKGRGRNERTELDEVLEEALRDQEGPLKVGDFDFAARRFLSEIRSRDRSDDTTRFNEAIDMVLKYTCSKERSSVRKWPAYVFTLLQKFDPVIWDELRERDAARRAQGPRDFAPRQNQEDRD